MLTLEKNKVILWEAESLIKNIVLDSDKNEFIKQVEQYMQEEPFYGDPDYSYY